MSDKGAKSIAVEKDLLIARRHRLGLTREQLAAKARVAPSTIQNMEDGKKVAYDKIHAVAPQIGLTYGQLVGLDPPPPDTPPSTERVPTKTQSMTIDAFDDGRITVTTVFDVPPRMLDLQGQGQQLFNIVYNFLRLREGFDPAKLTTEVGSVRVTVRLSPIDVAALMSAFWQKRLSEFHVIAVEVVDAWREPLLDDYIKQMGQILEATSKFETERKAAFDEIVAETAKSIQRLTQENEALRQLRDEIPKRVETPSIDDLIEKLSANVQEALASQSSHRLPESQSDDTDPR